MAYGIKNNMKKKEWKRKSKSLDILISKPFFTSFKRTLSNLCFLFLLLYIRKNENLDILFFSDKY
jgi:hypothetical protein